MPHSLAQPHSLAVRRGSPRVPAPAVSTRYASYASDASDARSASTNHVTPRHARPFNLAPGCAESRARLIDAYPCIKIRYFLEPS